MASQQKASVGAIPILIALGFAGALACGCAGGRSSMTAAWPSASPRLSADQEPPPATERAHPAKLIAAWSFEPWERPTSPVVWVYADGRVKMSRSLFTGGQVIEGQLTQEQLEVFTNALRQMTDGLAGRRIERSIGLHFPYYRFVIALPGRECTILESSFRIIEPRWLAEPAIYWRPDRKDWTRDRLKLPRFERLSEDYAREEMAIRETFIALEAEFLRAAAMALMNQVAPPPTTQPAGGDPAHGARP